MLLNLLNYILGYVKISVTGKFCERFINLCAYNNRDIWNIRKTKDTITAYVKIKEYKNLRYEARKSGAKVRIIEKKGIPFFVNRHRYRYGVPVGFCLLIVLLVSMSSHIWNINITGNSKVTEQAIINALSDSGVYIGMKHSTLDTPNIKESIMVKYDDIAWMSLNRVGTTLFVDISEGVKHSLDDQEPCNIIAKCDGIITSMKVYSGVAVAKVGDAVVKGDLLVSGVISSENAGNIYKCARAEVTAQTTWDFYSEIPLETEKMCRTGECVKKSVLHFFGGNVPLYIGENKGDWEIEKSQQMMSIDSVKLPIGFTTAKMYKLEKKTVVLSVQEAINQAKSDIAKRRDLLLGEGKGELLSTFVENDEKTVVLHEKYGNVEDIAIREKILIF